MLRSTLGLMSVFLTTKFPGSEKIGYNYFWLFFKLKNLVFSLTEQLIFSARISICYIWRVQFLFLCTGELLCRFYLISLKSSNLREVVCVLLCRVNREKYSGSHWGYFELIFCSFFRIKILSSKSCFNGSEVDRTISCWVPNGEISQGWNFLALIL